MKKRISHRIISWILTLGLLLGELVTPVMSYAAEEETVTAVDEDEEVGVEDPVGAAPYSVTLRLKDITDDVSDSAVVQSIISQNNDFGSKYTRIYALYDEEGNFTYARTLDWTCEVKNKCSKDGVTITCEGEDTFTSLNTLHSSPYRYSAAHYIFAVTYTNLRRRSNDEIGTISFSGEKWSTPFNKTMRLYIKSGEEKIYVDDATDYELVPSITSGSSYTIGLGSEQEVQIYEKNGKNIKDLDIAYGCMCNDGQLTVTNINWTSNYSCKIKFKATKVSETPGEFYFYLKDYPLANQIRAEFTVVKAGETDPDITGIYLVDQEQSVSFPDDFSANYNLSDQKDHTMIFQTLGSASYLTAESSNTDILTISLDIEHQTILFHPIKNGRTSVVFGSKKTNSTFSRTLNVVVSGFPTIIPITSIVVQPRRAQVLTGETVELTVNYLPSSATNKAITWSSSNTSVATVSDTGVVTGVAPGTATVTATTQDGSNKTSSCYIIVTAPVIGVIGVTVSPKILSLTKGSTGSVVATVAPSDASNKNVTYTSSKPSVATVSETGVVTAVAEGSTTITVTTEDGDYTDTCAVTVTEASAPEVKVTGVTVAPTELSLKKGQTGTLTATVAPANATNKNVSYSSTKTSVATVSETGVVTAVAKGEATIIVTTEDGGKTAMCSVTVTEDAESVSVSSVSLDEKTASLKVNETKKLTATVLPENATNKNVTWSSSDAAVATVSADGTVTAVAAGTADITVTTVDGAKTDKCVVTVTEEEVPPISVNGVSLNTNTASIKAGETTQLTAVVTPEEATNKNVVFSSDNTSVATVSDTGLVSGVKAGTANITVTTEDGGFTDTCTVTVTEDEPVNPEDPRPDPSDEPESDLGEDTYDDIIDYTEPRAIYLVKGQKVRIPGSTVTTNDKKVVAVSKPKAGYTTLTAKKNGLTPVTITNVSGNTLTHTFYVENPAFAKKSYKLGVGESQAFGVTLGANADKYTVYYRSSNQDIAYVAEGKLYAVSKGNATITAYINGRKFNCKVKVTDPASPKSVDGYETVKLVPNQQLNIKYNSGFKSKGATWTIVDGDPVKPVVSIKGSKVTAVSVGTAKLTGTDTNGTIKNLIIEVTEPDTQTLHLNIGSKKSVKFYKLNNKKATWTSSDNNIATVANGTIVGANPGTTTVTAVCNGVTYTTVVTVEEPVVVISENMTQSGKKYALNIMSGDTFQISLKNVSQAVAYTSDKPEIARVNNHGRIIASSAGKAKITAKINGVTITIIVNVFDRTTNAGIPAGYANSDASYEYDEAKDYSKEMGAL